MPIWVVLVFEYQKSLKPAFKPFSFNYKMNFGICVENSKGYFVVEILTLTVGIKAFWYTYDIIC